MAVSKSHSFYLISSESAVPTVYDLFAVFALSAVIAELELQHRVQALHVSAELHKRFGLGEPSEQSTLSVRHKQK